jgi:hypothetical protein
VQATGRVAVTDAGLARAVELGPERRRHPRDPRSRR